jgi:hypothetical protein
MALTITPPAEYTAAYNPIIIEAVSDVRDNFTFGAAKTVSSVSSTASGYINLNFSAAHSLLKGDFVLLSAMPGLEELEGGVFLIIAVVDTDTVTISKRYTTGLSASGTGYKYIKNYNAFLKFYIYTKDAPGTEKYVANKTLKPGFKNGYCFFRIDVSDLVRLHTYKENSANAVMPGKDFFPINDSIDLQVNEDSFLVWGYIVTEGFDNPAGGLPTYDQDSTVS